MKAVKIGINGSWFLRSHSEEKEIVHVELEAKGWGWGARLPPEFNLGEGSIPF